MTKKVIGLGGNARAGKDSTFYLLEKYLPVKRVAFADRLKEVTNDLCTRLYGISTFTTETSQKEILRPMLVAVGNTARAFNERIWVDQTIPLIKEIQNNGYIPVITDVRFINEANFLKDENNGILIHVDRILDNGCLQPPANSSEAENYPILKERADIKIIAANLEELEKEVVSKILPILNISIENRV